jgi:hypothetical protein
MPADDVNPSQPAAHHRVHVTAAFDYRALAGIGHNIPQEAPQAVVDAVVAVALPRG